jgi:ribosomal-protein-alanine N-acetyltransferase
MFSFLRKPAAPSIRPIGPSEAQDCARLHAASFAHPWSALEFESLLAGKNAMADGAYAGNARLIGFALSRQAADEAEVLSVAVVKSERVKGVGRALMGAHLAGLARAGVRTVFLEVEPGNVSAVALYGRLGFQAVGERKNYYRTGAGVRAPALTLRCDLG